MFNKNKGIRKMKTVIIKNKFGILIAKAISKNGKDFKLLSITEQNKNGKDFCNTTFDVEEIRILKKYSKVNLSTLNSIIIKEFRMAYGCYDYNHNKKSGLNAFLSYLMTSINLGINVYSKRF